MSNVSVKEQLKKLVELQVIDFEIYGLKRELIDKPLLVEQLKKKYEEKQAGLKVLDGKFKGVLVDRKARELELQAKEGEIVKANTQLFSLKTNKEYQAKLSEIENMKADKSVIEEKILALYDDADKVSADIEKEKGFLAVEEKKYLTQKKEVDDRVKEIQERMKILEMKRNQVTPGIEKPNLVRYERVLSNKDGLAIAAVVNSSSCGGCFMNVPAQVVNEIKMYDRLISCEMCSRVLYIEDDL